MRYSKSNPAAWRDRVLITSLLVCAGLLIIFGVIWLASTSSAPSPRPPSTSTEKSSVKKAETQDLREAPSGGDARVASWISFERILLLAVVFANYLLLAVVAWSYWRGRRLNTGADLSQRLQSIGAQLEAIERALRTGPPKPATSPSPVIPSPAPRPKAYEPPAPSPAPEPVRQTPVFRESPPPPMRARHGHESHRSLESDAWKLVLEYCQVWGSSIVDLAQHAEALGLQIGSPSSTRGQRHFLGGPDQDPRLLAIKNGREEKLFLVAGAGAEVAESEWLDLFEMRSFPGYCKVRSKRPATVNAASGEVEERGELEVLGST